MRVEIGLAATLVLLATAVGTSWSAGPPQGTKVAVPQRTMNDLNAATRPGSVAQSTPAAGASALTAQECTDMGGTVYVEGVGLCASGKYCGKVDNLGKKHRFCLEVQ